MDSTMLIVTHVESSCIDVHQVSNAQQAQNTSRATQGCLYHAALASRLAQQVVCFVECELVCFVKCEQQS